MRVDQHPDLGDTAALRSRLRHVYWIGGGSGAGKSTVAGLIAARCRLRVYSTDEAMADHARRCAPEDAPFLRDFAAMDMDERWVRRTPRAMLESFHWFRGEGFGLILDDLARLPREPAVIAEGFRLLPPLLAPYLAAPDRAVWLLPTPDFRRAAFESRGSIGDIPRKTSAPQRALQNLLERDRMFTDRLREQTGRLGLRALQVDCAVTKESLAEQVAQAFGL